MAFVISNTRIALDAAIGKVGDMLVEAIADAYVLQGHDLSGSLVSSIAWRTKLYLDSIGLQVELNTYGIYLDTGVKASRIPFTRGSGGGRSKYITALTKYVLARGFVTGLKKARSIAFAIAQVQKKEGMSTNKAHEYSKTGRRTGAITQTLDDSQQAIEELMERELIKGIDLEITNFVTELAKQYG